MSLLATISLLVGPVILKILKHSENIHSLYSLIKKAQVHPIFLKLYCHPKAESPKEVPQSSHSLHKYAMKKSTGPEEMHSNCPALSKEHPDTDDLLTKDAYTYNYVNKKGPHPKKSSCK